MKVVIAIDSFKGSMTSLEAGYAARDGVLKARPDAEVKVLPLADGGEGTVAALTGSPLGRLQMAAVTGPLGDPVQAAYGITDEGRTAVMEMAAASGIMLIEKSTLDPWKASTTGVGEMIADAVSRGCREFIIGIGGSATTEGGIGMLAALGYEFYDAAGRKLPSVFGSLGKIESIKTEHVMPELKACRFNIACDVTNPLCGNQGAVYVYGPQKGVKAEEIGRMDAAMRHYAAKTAEHFGRDFSAEPGAGAAGGLGFAFLSYMPHAKLRSGIDIVLEKIGFEKAVSDADIVITGEGRLDSQTAMGKVPVGTARAAKKYGCRVLAFAGSVTDDAAVCNEKGIDAFFPIIRSVTTLDEAMDRKNAVKNMRLSVEQVFRLL